MAKSSPLLVIVDDDESIRNLHIEIAKSAGFENIVTATNGLEGYEKICQGEIPCLILTDFSMPGCNGDVMVSRLRKNKLFSEIPIIMITGNTNVDMSSGATCLLVKPGYIDFLEDLLKIFLNKAL